MRLFLGLDLGTSYFKVGLFDEQGTLRGLGRTAVPKVTPAPGRCELSIEGFWSTLRAALHQALAKAGAEVSQIAALSYSSQASTFLLLDQNEEPLTPFVVWLDARGELEPSLVEFSNSASYATAIGHRGLSPQTAAGKWRWFQRHAPALWKKTQRAMTLSDYLTFSLTGELAGDAGTAAFLGVYDLSTRTWWPEALAAFAIPAQRLSTPLLPGTRCGQTRAEATRLLGLPTGIPFTVGSLDHHVGAIGAGLGRAADISITTGTVLAALALVDRVAPKENCFFGPHTDGKEFYCLAFTPEGAGKLEVYQRTHAPDLSIDDLLASIEPGHPAHSQHGEPVFGLLREVARAHQTLIATAVGPAAATPILATGGGARSPRWLQTKADVLRRPLLTAHSAEPGCLGAAMLAAAGSGAFRNLEEAQAAMTRPGSTYLPQVSVV